MPCEAESLVTEVPELQYYGALHAFLITAASASAAAGTFSFSLLWTGCKLAGVAAYYTAAATLVPLGTVLTWLVWLCAAHFGPISWAVLLFAAWQIYFPSRLLIRLLAKLPYCRGVAFEFAPSSDQHSQQKYVALTINDAPSPYGTAEVLDELKMAGAKATFFIVGSHVETCDVIGVGPWRSGGEGHYPLGQETLCRMYTEGHELGNQTWHGCPSHTLPPKQLFKDICDVHKVIQSARQAALSVGCPDDDLDCGTSTVPFTAFRTKWFRPAGGWFTPEMVEIAQKLGYHTVLGSVWPWDVYSRWPLLNALYICAKVQTGAVIVLHNRGRHLLPTLQIVLPWLSKMGYDVTTLSEAALRSNGDGPELTLAALEEHNNNQGSRSLGSNGSGYSLDAAPDMLRSYSLPGNMSRMATESERAALEEIERQHLKALEWARADRRAGIDRRIVDMSAADKHAIIRREREKKEAEIRRARRKIEEARARERYDQYVKDRAVYLEREKQERAKAEEMEERRRQAEEAFNRRKELERKYAEEMIARQRAAADASAEDDMDQDYRRRGMFSKKRMTSVATNTDSYMEPLAAESQLPDESYSWYGRTPSPDSAAALAVIDKAVAEYAAAHAAGEQLPRPVTGSYACGLDGRALLGFDGHPLVLSLPRRNQGAEGHPVLLSHEGKPVIGPEGEKILLLLGANDVPLADPHGRPVFIAQTVEGTFVGVHPDGSIIKVPSPAATASPEHKVSSRRGSRSAARHQRSSSANKNTIKEAGSYAASREGRGTSGAANAAAASTGSGKADKKQQTAAAQGSDSWVPAELMLGPSGLPLLGFDNRPLIVAVGDDGSVVTAGFDGQPLLGPDGEPLKFGCTSDGSLVVLDSLCRPLVASSGGLQMMALTWWLSTQRTAK